jgi:hypothetical protein
VKAESEALREARYPVALLQILAVGLGLSVVVAWIATSYFGVDVPGSLVWPGTDGFCDTRSQGVGSHCFSDISLHLSVGQALVPADPGLVQYVSNLPPGNRVLLWIFQLFASWFGFRATLVIYLTLSAAALLVPALWVARRRSWHQAAVTLLLISVATVPFLAILDRGNTIAFTVPLVLVFVVALWRGHDWWALGAVVAVSQIKPQLGLIVVAFFVLRRVRMGLTAIGISAAVFVSSFAIFALPGSDSSPLQEFKRFVLFSQMRGSYLPLDAPYPVNVSFQKVIFEIGNGLLGLSLSAATIQTGLLALTAMVIVALIWRGREIPYPIWIAAILMASALVVAVTFIYYYALVLVVVAVLMRNEDFAFHPKKSPVVSGVLSAAVVFSLTPLLIPGGWAEAPVPTRANGVVVSLLPYIASTTWLLLVLGVGAWVVLRSATKSKDWTVAD